MSFKNSSESPSADYFATTHWSVVVTAGQGNGTRSEHALEELCRNYWYPLFAYVRRQGCTKEDAEDLTQAFFVRFLSKNYLKDLSIERGKFRAFLLACLKHFLANEWDRTRRLKRGGGKAVLSIDSESAELRYGSGPVDHLSPDKLYDRAWAMTLLARVLSNLRSEIAHLGQEKTFEQLKPFLTTAKESASYAQTAIALGLTEGATRVAVHRLRVRYRELLRQEICQTLVDPTQADEEMHALFGAFAND